MEAFEFGKACVAITTRLLEMKMVPDEVWKRYLPRAINSEIKKAENLYPTLGLRSPVTVQQCICNNIWDNFNSGPPPWVVNDTVSFGVGEEMEIALIKVALKVSSTDVKAALRILAKNSTDGEPTASQEPGSDIKAGAESTNLVTPTTPKAQSSPKPTTQPNQVSVPIPVPVSATTPTVKPTPNVRQLNCLFGSWKDESGKALPAFPGAAPGEIVLPDNMDPMLYLLPIQADMEAWLNMRLYFERKTQTSHNKIKIKPAKVRDRARPAEVDMRYGLIAFNVLLRWTNAMIEQGKMIPVIEFIRHDLGCGNDLQVERTATRMLLEPRIEKAPFPGPIKAITTKEMKMGSSKYHPPSTPKAAPPKSKQSPISLNLNLPKRPAISANMPKRPATSNLPARSKLSEYTGVSGPRDFKSGFNRRRGRSISPDRSSPYHENRHQTGADRPELDYSPSNRATRGGIQRQREEEEPYRSYRKDRDERSPYHDYDSSPLGLRHIDRDPPRLYSPRTNEDARHLRNRGDRDSEVFWGSDCPSRHFGAPQ
ncbi:hypothetical protein GQX73_g4526 [Xylaria multiplex]|uniref:Uncharacterized protein n=1 Tax=Xylaria multiplex TaxID=323545 RepID=A0A7C8N5X9_9PEZI|nr:hypothetical protein GQX73_g4526 [Xylaria multiplex]